MSVIQRPYTQVYSWCCCTRDQHGEDALLDACTDCDVLMHEAYAQATYAKVAPRWQSYRRKYHTSSKELAELARQTQPGLLVLYHRANIGAPPTVPDSEDVLLDEVRQAYEGDVVSGHDLDIF